MIFSGTKSHRIFCVPFVHFRSRQQKPLPLPLSYVLFITIEKKNWNYGENHSLDFTWKLNQNCKWLQTPSTRTENRARTDADLEKAIPAQFLTMQLKKRSGWQKGCHWNHSLVKGVRVISETKKIPVGSLSLQKSHSLQHKSFSQQFRIPSTFKRANSSRKGHHWQGFHERDPRWLSLNQKHPIWCSGMLLS